LFLRKNWPGQLARQDHRTQIFGWKPTSNARSSQDPHTTRPKFLIGSVRIDTDTSFEIGILQNFLGQKDQNRRCQGLPWVLKNLDRQRVSPLTPKLFFPYIQYYVVQISDDQQSCGGYEEGSLKGQRSADGADSIRLL